MIKPIITVIFILLVKFVLSQNGPCTSSFCQYVNKTNFDIAITGKIIEIDSIKASILITDILLGEENRDTITIYSNVDTIFAEGSPDEELISRSTIHLGKKNETIVIPLIQILTLENESDVIHDYRIPTKIYNTPWLKVKNDIVFGRIYVDDDCFPSKKIEEMSYDKFESYWVDGNFNCDNLVSVEKAINTDAQIRIDNNFIIVNHEDPHEFETEVYNIKGELVFSEKSRCELTIDINAMKKGMLIVKVYDRKGIIRTQKILNR